MKTPPELNIQIIHCLSDDLCALRNCSLTCQQWSEVARPLKFREVTFGYVQDLTRFRALVDEKPGIRDLVKAVHIRTPSAYAHPSLFSMATGEIGGEIPSSLPSGKTALYPVIKDTSPHAIPGGMYTNGDQAGAITRAVTDILQLLQHVTKLTVSLCHIEDRSLGEIITSLPKLGHFELVWCDIFSRLSNATPLSHRPPLKRVRVKASGPHTGANRPAVHDALGDVLRWSLCDGIEILDMDSISRSTLVKIVVEEAAPSLVELRLNLMSTVDTRFSQERTTNSVRRLSEPLRTSGKLQRLTVVNPRLYRSSVPEDYKWFPMLEFLNVCPTLPALRYLQLDPAEYDGDPHERVVQVLNNVRPKFPQLSEVDIIHYGDAKERQALVDGTYSKLGPSISVRLVTPDE